jgi:opacity protein-like surface antigen
MITRIVAVCLLSVGWVATAADAHSVAFRLGAFAPRIDSALWADNFETFTIERGDFDAVIGGVEVGVELSDHADLSFGVETSSKTVLSMYRDFVRDDGTEILQDLSLRTTPITVGVRVFPISKTQRVLPYVTGGAAFYVYEYREEGEFVDLDTLDIFGDVFVDRGVAYGAYLGAGVELGVTDRVFGLAEYRRHWGRASHGDDFDGFGGFDLSANEVSFGVNLRF